MTEKSYDKLNFTLIQNLKRKIDALKESEKKYSALIETTNTGFVIIDGTGKVMDANQEYVRLSGHKTLADIIGRSVVEWTAEYEKERNAKEVGKCFKQGFVRNLEIDYVDPRGKVTPIEVNATVVKTKDGPLIMTLCRNITERRAAEQALKDSENKYRTLLENLPQKIFLKDRDSVYISCNQAYARDLKIRPEEIKGKTDYDFYPKKLAEKYRADDRKIMKAGKVEEIEESYIQDGKGLSVHTVKVPVKDKNGDVTGVLGIFWDITEKKKAEEALRETREYLDNLLNYANAPIIVWDNKKNITLFNKAFESFTGHKQKAILGKKIDLLFPTSQKTKILQTIEKATRGEKWKTVEIPILCKDQKIKIALWNSANITDHDGRMVATIAQGQDITEKKKAEEALQETKERYAQLFEQSNDTITLVDLTGKIIGANKKTTELTAYTSKELLNMFVWQLVPESEQKNVGKSFKRCLLGKEERVETLALRKDGQIINIEMSANMIKLKDASFVQTIVRDITERKKAEERLRYFQKAVDGSSDAIGMSTPEGKHYYQNEAFNKMFGLTVEEVRGTKGPPTVYVDEEVGCEVFKTIMGGGAYTGEVEMETKRGKILSIFLRAYAIKDEKGKVIGLVGVHTDITEKKKTEEKLVEQKERYETEIKELKKKLQKIK